MIALKKTIMIAENSNNPLVVNRLGYGTMRLTGEGIYGEPPNRAEALEILKACVAKGINFLDTADYYGEDVTNRLIKEALYPYADCLVICTKVGATRRPDKSWIPYNSTEDVKTAIENNLKTLQIDQIDLVHCRVMPGSKVTFEASLETLFELQQQGKIVHVGVSNVSRAELEKALTMGEIATVENMYGYAQRTTLITPYGENRGGEEVLDLCEANHIPLIPYFSLINAIGKKDEKPKLIAEKYGVTVAQINIAWQLHKSPWILPIPGTKQMQHFEENIQAVHISLTEDDMAFLG